MAAIIFLTDKNGDKRFLAYPNGKPIEFVNVSFGLSWFEESKDRFDIDVEVDYKYGRGGCECENPLEEHPPNTEDWAYRLKEGETVPENVLKGAELPPPPTIFGALSAIFGVPEERARDGVALLTGEDPDRINNEMAGIAPHLFSHVETEVPDDSIVEE